MSTARDQLERGVARLSVPLRDLIGIVVTVHLVMVAVFVFTGFPNERPGPGADALRTYRNLAGIFRDYTFFAPAVASDSKVSFLVEDVAGEVTVVSFAPANREVAFRLSCMMNACLRDERARDLFAQSWAAAVFGSRPEAVRVTVMAMTLEVPTMTDRRNGADQRWVPLYAGEFVRTDATIPGSVR